MPMESVDPAVIAELDVPIDTSVRSSDGVQRVALFLVYEDNAADRPAAEHVSFDDMEMAQPIPLRELTTIDRDRVERAIGEIECIGAGARAAEDGAVVSALHDAVRQQDPVVMRHVHELVTNQAGSMARRWRAVGPYLQWLAATPEAERGPRQHERLGTAVRRAAQSYADQGGGVVRGIAAAQRILDACAAEIEDESAASAHDHGIENEILAAMQNAEEAGGPEGRVYVNTMLHVARQALSRVDTYVADSPEGQRLFTPDDEPEIGPGV